jgi:hypothetical protein
MDGPDVIIEQLHVAAGDLKGRRAVAEDSLEGEDVPTVHQERPGEAVTQDMRRAPRRDLCGTSQTANEQLDAARRKDLVDQIWVSDPHGLPRARDAPTGRSPRRRSPRLPPVTGLPPAARLPT